MEEYLKQVEEQIRCKKARPFIRQELKDHIEDQMNHYMQSGISQTKALKMAVKEMGDPVETGISLDHIHRPKTAYHLLLLIALISLVGCMIQTGIAGGNTEVAVYASSRYPIYMLLGLTVMFLFYAVDYTNIARYSKVIALLLILTAFCVRFMGLSINGRNAWIYIGGGISISIHALMLLYVPIYAGILYSYRKNGYLGILKAILWMFIPVIELRYLAAYVTSGVLLISMTVLLIIAISKNWFTVSKVKTISGILGICLFFPLFTAAVLYYNSKFAPYQMERIQQFLNGYRATNYTMGFHSDYILQYVFHTYGIFAVTGICCILAILLLAILSIAIKQKNQLGFLMGCAADIVFLVNILLNILENMEIIPPVNTVLPFFSTGGSNLIVFYALLGLVLNIYRYKDIYPDNFEINMIKNLPNTDCR